MKGPRHSPSPVFHAHRAFGRAQTSKRSTRTEHRRTKFCTYEGASSSFGMCGSGLVSSSARKSGSGKALCLGQQLSLYL